ncbi:hypothetical protein LY76DRAFT_470039, partial [Colletotrichum caudatum]
GQRMAHEAAQAQGDIAPQVLDLFEKSCVQEDPGWFVEHGHGTRSGMLDDEEQAYRNLLPLLPSLVDGANSRAYITAPLVDETAMKGFLRALPAF